MSTMVTYLTNCSHGWLHGVPLHGHRRSSQGSCNSDMFRPVINVVGGIVWGVTVFTTLLLTLSYTHITSDKNVYTDEVSSIVILIIKQ